MNDSCLYFVLYYVSLAHNSVYLCGHLRIVPLASKIVNATTQYSFVHDENTRLALAINMAKVTCNIDPTTIYR